MKLAKILLALIVTFGSIYILNRSNQIGETSLPPLGNLLSPYTGYVQSAETEADLKNKIIQIEGMEGSVTIIFDQNLVPHIYADHQEDLFFAQGYVQAMHRLWQMDMSTRSAAGRLSEVLGEDMLEYDKLQRRKGLLAGAQKNLEFLEKDPVANQIMNSFVKGVNTYISSLSPADYPIEYKLMDFSPEPYTKLKITLYFKSMEQTLNSREVDIESTNTLTWLGKDLFREIFPDINPVESPVIPASVDYDFRAEEVKKKDSEVLGMIPHRPFEKPFEGIGSNNWAVSPSKTKSGYAILANDPHLTLTLPSIWYEIHLMTPEINVYGVSLPGVPGVTIGFNENVAWGMTNVGQDVADWFKIKWADEQKVMYWLDDKKVKVDYRIEKFRLNDGSMAYDTIKWTYWGPIVHENEAHPFLDLAYKWLPHDVPENNQIQTFLNLAKARNHSDYLEAISHFGSPAQNVVFGSREGDIALSVTGRFPIKSKDQGRFVLDGSSKANDWKGFIPFDHGARVLNPERGFVASANQRSTDTSYPYAYHGGFSDFRGRTLNKLLTQAEEVSLKDMMNLQQNSYSLKAEESLPFFIENLNDTLDTDAQIIVKELKAWDYHFNQYSVASVYFDIWSDEFYDMVWDEMIAKNEDEPILFPEYWHTINLAKNKPEHDFFDIDSTNQIELASDIINASFLSMLNKVNEMKISDWSSYSDLDINHLARIAPFNAENVVTAGHSTALNATYGPRQHGPSWENGGRIERRN